MIALATHVWGICAGIMPQACKHKQIHTNTQTRALLGRNPRNWDNQMERAETKELEFVY